MTAQLTPHFPEIHYRLIPQEHGVTLELWEPVPKGVRALKPYRFRLRYDLASAQAAHQMLDIYLKDNPATQARPHPADFAPASPAPNQEDALLALTYSGMEAH